MTNEEKRNIYNAIQNLYNMDFTTWQEVLAMMYNLVADVEQQFEAFQQKLELMLGKEVTEAIKKMYDDGTLAQIINEEIFSDLNNKIDKVEAEILMTLTDEIARLEKDVTDNINTLNIKTDNIVKNREYVEVVLNDYKDIAKYGTSDEDWTLAFDYVFSNVIKNKCGTVTWNGLLKIKSTINLPYGVNLKGASLPYSGLIPSTDFVGEYCIKQTSNEAHVDIRDIYIAFEQNPNIGGIYIEHPYDYSTLDNIVGTITKRELIKLGSEIGSEIGQTIRIQNCICYGNTERLSPMITLYNQQEVYLANNKFLYNGTVTTQWECLRADGITNSTFINNSFANTNGHAINIKADKYPKRVSGNTFIGNLFENVMAGINGTVNITSGTGTDTEGYDNAFFNNVFLNSDNKLLFNNIANTVIIGTGEITGTARRNFQFNPLGTNATDPYGSTILIADGGTLKTNGDIESTLAGGGIKLRDSNGNIYRISINTSGELQVNPL